MTHDELVAEIQRRARELGILSHYCGQAQHCKADRGMPDLVLVGPYRAAFVEVKTEWAQMDPGQTTWMHALTAAGELHFVVRPADLDGGRVDGLLESLAYGQDVLFRGHSLRRRM